MDVEMQSSGSYLKDLLIALTSESSPSPFRDGPQLQKVTLLKDSAQAVTDGGQVKKVWSFGHHVR